MTARDRSRIAIIIARRGRPDMDSGAASETENAPIVSDACQNAALSARRAGLPTPTGLPDTWDTHRLPIGARRAVW